MVVKKTQDDAMCIQKVITHSPATASAKRTHLSCFFCSFFNWGKVKILSLEAGWSIINDEEEIPRSAYARVLVLLQKPFSMKRIQTLSANS